MQAARKEKGGERLGSKTGVTAGKNLWNRPEQAGQGLNGKKRSNANGKNRNIVRAPSRGEREEKTKEADSKPLGKRKELSAQEGAGRTAKRGPELGAAPAVKQMRVPKRNPKEL